ncbi:MAG: glycosyltransferase [Bacteroidales bacterium]|nr:glycosyltransferase [Bacteroidales bacterium]MCF8336493.1 glycosyltransferase [Bacteroidales bacterium]
MARKVCLIGPAYPYRGGIAAFNERMARAFIANGDQVHLFTFSLQYPRIFFPGKTQFSNEPFPHDLDIRRTINSINPFSWYVTANELIKLAPDLVIINYWLPYIAPALGSIARLIRKKGNFNTIAIPHNLKPHERRMGDWVLSKYFVESVDGFLSMSKSVVNDLKEMNSQKPGILSLHPLYDHYKGGKDKLSAREELDLDRETKYLLFFGFIRDYKGLDLLIKAMSHLKSRMKKLILIVAGEFYSNSDKYYKLIKDLGLQQHISLKTEFIPDSKVGLYFSVADLIVQPYKSATQSGVTQIAYHFEKPMIVTNVGGLGELIPDGKVGYVVNPDENSIADAIYRYFKEDKEQEFVENIKEEKKKYSWTSLLDNIDQLDKKIKEINS